MVIAALPFVPYPWCDDPVAVALRAHSLYIYAPLDAKVTLLALGHI